MFSDLQLEKKSQGTSISLRKREIKISSRTVELLL